MRERLAASRATRDERGLSMIEVIIASGLFFSLLVAVLSMLDSGTKVERVQQARHDALLELRSAMTRVTTEVRQAVAVAAESTPTRLTIETLRTGAERWTVFQLLNDELLVRRCAALPCTGNATSLTSNVFTGSFCYDPPSCVSTSASTVVSTIRISLTVEPDVPSADAITLSTDVELRNF